MDTTTPLHALARLDLVSIPLAAAGPLPVHLAGLLNVLAGDLPAAPEAVTQRLVDLDRHLTDDPVGGTAAFLDGATDDGDLVDRCALLQLARRCGADLPAPAPAAGEVAALPRKRRQTLLETVLTRVVAVDHSPAQACAIAGLEAGASAIELAHTTPDDLQPRPDGGWQLTVPGSRDAACRVLDLPAWCAGAATRLAAGPLGGDWLLHTSTSTVRDRRTSTLLMSVRAVLDDCTLLRPDTVTAESIRRTALTRAALDGTDGWARAVTAAGHRNPAVTDRLLRLAEAW